MLSWTNQHPNSRSFWVLLGYCSVVSLTGRMPPADSYYRKWAHRLACFVDWSGIDLVDGVDVTGILRSWCTFWRKRVTSSNFVRVSHKEIPCLHYRHVISTFDPYYAPYNSLMVCLYFVFISCEASLQPSSLELQSGFLVPHAPHLTSSNKLFILNRDCLRFLNSNVLALLHVHVLAAENRKWCYTTIKDVSLSGWMQEKDVHLPWYSGGKGDCWGGGGGASIGSETVLLTVHPSSFNSCKHM